MLKLLLSSNHIDTILEVLEVEAYELGHNATDNAESEAAERIYEVIEAINAQL